MKYGPIVVDTDLVIDFLRGAGVGAAVVPRWLRSAQLRLSAITLFELRSGLDWQERGRSIESLFVHDPLPFDKDAALRAGDVETTLRSSGMRIGVADTQQAGVCLAANLPLATRNVKHFNRVRGLELVDLDSH